MRAPRSVAGIGALLLVLAVSAPAGADEVPLHADPPAAVPGPAGLDAGAPPIPAPRPRIRAAATASDYPVAVILVHFTDAPDNQSSSYYTAADVRRQVYGSAVEDQFSVRQYFLEQTYGKVDLRGAASPDGDVYGSYGMAMGPYGCNPGVIAQGALAGAQADGFDMDRYKAIVYVFSSQRCGFAGLGGGGPQVWLNGMNRYTLAHELGHTFGSDHARSLRCRDAGGTTVTLSDTCDADEYGDPFDPMGSGGTLTAANGYSEAIPHQMEPMRKLKMGALAQSDTLLANTPGSYHLEPIERSAGTRMLRLPARDGKYFDLSFRRPIGLFDSTWNDPDSGNPRAFDGVLVNLDSKDGGSDLLDMTPETPAGGTHPFTHRPLSGFEDAPLTAGRSFSDPHTGLTLTVSSVGDAGAEVTVAYGQGAVDVATPTVPGTPTVTVAGGVVTLGWGPSSDAYGVQRYVVQRDGASIAEPTATGATDRPGPGTFLYSVRAVDAAGNVSPASGAVTVTVPSGAPPGPGPDPEADPLTLTGLKLGSRFRLGVATKIRFTLNRAAAVKLTFARQLPGRRSGKRCLAPAKAPRGKRCTRAVAVRKPLAVAGRQGANSVSFAGRIDRKTALAPGAYVVSAVASEGTVSSKAATAKFTLQPAKR